jgi:hypothetical protein
MSLFISRHWNIHCEIRRKRLSSLYAEKNMAQIIAKLLSINCHRSSSRKSMKVDWNWHHQDILCLQRGFCCFAGDEDRVSSRFCERISSLACCYVENIIKLWSPTVPRRSVPALLAQTFFPTFLSRDSKAERGTEGYTGTEWWDRKANK